MKRVSGLSILLILFFSLCVSGYARERLVCLPGFEISPHWREQVKEFTLAPGVKIHINAPAPERFYARKRTRVIFYALPNGNTTAHTIGKVLKEGDDWHYGIQHIGAQTRRLREIISKENVVVAYLETEEKSWPAWRKKYENSGELIAGVIRAVTEPFAAFRPSVVLSGHSGGGSFIFGYLNFVERIPDAIERISFLDSNYGFSDEDGHGRKLIEWLQRDKAHFLSVIAYDDRNITLDGKPVVGPTGGTWRATHRMIDSLSRDTPLEQVKRGDLVVYTGLKGRVEMILHKNPENKILHTLLVEKNGFLHAMTCETRYEKSAGEFFGTISYEKWIQGN